MFKVRYSVLCWNRTYTPKYIGFRFQSFHNDVLIYAKVLSIWESEIESSCQNVESLLELNSSCQHGDRELKVLKSMLQKLNVNL